jgi:hypothetical protein
MRVVISFFCVASVLGVGAWKFFQTHPEIVRARSGGELARVECAGLSFLSPGRLTPSKSGAVPANVERQQTFACHSFDLTLLASEVSYKAKSAPTVHTAAISALSGHSRQAATEKPVDAQVAPASIAGLDGARFSAAFARARRPQKTVGWVLANHSTFWTLQVIFDPQDKAAEANALRILDSIQPASQFAEVL